VGGKGWVTMDLRGLGVRETAEAIAAAELVVLVNLHGWTAGHAMGALAFQPAPVQINFKGFPFSTGAAYTTFSAGVT
jgi:protein O-GlcNAc transferase